MPDIATVLKDEIARLARRELRREMEPLKKIIARQRTEVAELKRQLGELGKQVASGEKRRKIASTVTADNNSATRFRFSAQGLRALRERLDLSAAGFGTLVGVSAQTIYNWESEGSSPREKQLAAIAALRGIGKREAAARLRALVEPSSSPG